MKRIHQMLNAAARARGSELGIIDHDDRSYDWAAIKAGAEAARDALIARGVQPGDRVVIVLENSAAMVAFLYACSMMDAIACPVNARLTDPEIDRILRHSEAAAAVMTVATGPAPRQHAERMGAEEVPLPTGTVAILCRDGATPEPVHESPEHQIAILLYTSGTTGMPKGAMLSHAAMLNSAAASEDLRDLAAEDVTYLALPMSHIFGLATILAITRSKGAVRLEARFDVARLFEALRTDITVLPAVPQMHAQLFHYARKQGVERYEAGILRYTSSGGAPLDPAWKREAEDFYGVALQNGYGLTESSSGVCATKNELGDPDNSVGVPMLGSEVRVNTTAPGSNPAEGIGEVEIGGPQLMLGYFRDPEATAAAMTSDGWLRSGDLGRFDRHGRLHIVGRTKELIIHSGFNIYPAEIEAVLTEHPDVILAAVVGRRIEGGNEEVVAFVTTVPESGLTEAALKAYLHDLLAPYKRPVRIVVADALPAAPSGKILKSGLLEYFAEELEAD